MGKGTILAPVYGQCPAVAGRQVHPFAVGFEPFGISAGKWLIIELTGKDGRQVRLKVMGRMILRMRAIDPSRP